MLEYSLKSVEIESAGTGYVVNDALTIDLDTDDAKLKVTGVTADKYAVATATASGTMSGYAASETITIPGTTSDTAAVLTVASVTPTLYNIASATVSGESMTGYVTGETITIPGSTGDTAAVLAITAVEGVITELTVTTAGSFANEISGTLSADDYTYTGTGTGATFAVVGGVVDAGGAITALTVTTAGVFASNIAGSVSSDNIVYEGEGTGLELSVTTSTIQGGAITNVVISDIGESTTDTVENPVNVSGGTGSGATFNIVLASIFEEVEVTDVPGTMPKPATEVNYMTYNVSYDPLPIDYNTTFTREYPVEG